MPTNRKRSTRSRRAPPIDSDDWAFLTDETPENPFTEFLPDNHWRDLWEQHGDRITSEWVERYPGTRPTHWWKFDAPRRPGPDGYEGRESWLWLEPRLQISGTPVECDASARASRKALPNWDGDEPDYQADPPVFESELAYLKRHGLLLPGEGKRAK